MSGDALKCCGRFHLTKKEKTCFEWYKFTMGKADFQKDLHLDLYSF